MAACSPGSTHASPPPTATTTTLPTINQGGSIVVAAEGEPGCMDWISTCAGSEWGVWTVETNTMPRAYDFTADDQYKPSILLTGEADVRAGPAQVVTYHLNSRAVWSDGQPITSHDFQYTWDQIAHGGSISDQAGYRDIVSVDDADPHTAVVTFSQPYADWRKLFGGQFGLMPSHLLEGQDRNALMKDGYSWSGGPWELAPEGWVKGQSITLVPNLNYWGKKPDLASVTFRIITDPGAELQAYTAGQVVAAYPAPEPVAAGYRGVAGTTFSALGGLDYEALWFNLQQAPVSSKALRQALAYSLDRGAVVTQLVGQVDTTAHPIQALLTPEHGQYYTEAFAKYRLNLATAAQLMQADGWAKGADGVWAKAGQRASFVLKVSGGSVGGEQATLSVATQLKAAGFSVTVQSESPAQLTGDLQAGTFQAALYPVDLRRQPPGGIPAGSGIADNDPGQCRLFCSSEIPAAAAGAGAPAGAGGAAAVAGAPAGADPDGANYGRVSDPTLDRYLPDLDANLSDNARVTDEGQIAAILADLVPAVPLAALPDLVVVNTEKLAAEGGTFNHNLAYGPYAYLNVWYLK